MENFVVGIDCGTQKVKVVVVDESGNIVVRGSAAYEPPIYPKPGWVEQNPEEWWIKLCNLTKATLGKSGISPRSLVACGVSTHRFTKIAVNNRGKPLRNAILWLDAREVPTQWEESDPNVLSPSDLFYLSCEKILWMKKYEPEIFLRAHKFLGLSSYVAYRLTGNFVDSSSSAFADEFLDLGKNDWDPKKLGMFGIPREKLADLVPPGSLLGHVSKNAADDSGLPHGLPVIAGAGDKMCEGLGIGVTKPNMASVSCGTLTTVQTISKNYLPQDEFLTLSSAVPRMWNSESSTGGFSIISWYLRQLNWVLDGSSDKENKAKEKNLDELAAKVKPGASGLLVLPHFHSFYPGWKYFTKGAIIGLSISLEVPQMYRGFIEGIALGVRKSIEGFEKTFGRIKEARICGGGASSDFVGKVFSDSLGIPVCRTESKENIEYAGAKGAAIDAAKGGGLYDSVVEAAENMVHVKERIEPDSEIHKSYSRLFEVYGKAYQSLQESLRILYEINTQ